MNKTALSDQITVPKNKPFIIAEMSGNHNQSLERAIAIVDAAADAGAHAIKLQTYTADTITIEGAHTITDEKSLWKGKELYDLYKEAYTPWEWHKPIFDHAAKRGILAFSSPFDVTAVDFLEQLNVPMYKIASFENTDHILLKKVAATGKPIIMSTGVSTLGDIEESVKILKQNGCQELTLLKCTSTYPASPENTNLLAIPHLATLFNCKAGLSDHTMGIGASVAAVALGASVIEKHFTLNRADGGVDSAFSLEPHELKSLVIETERAYLALGTPFLGIQEAEEKSLFYKRSLFAIKDIEAGEAFTILNIDSKRPAKGLPTKHYEHVLTKKAAISIKKGTPITWDLLR
ncbi:MAG: pseudaminic acid synthase [Bacteroidia bacterium]|jgi:pseudaminic acid synthase|nr:pseudaminic acid synthase [Bacteroidia bacterium]